MSCKIISGIYKISNLSNDKFYIGSSINIYKRWIKHKSELRSNIHHSRYLQKSWNKYGEFNFEFVLLEECQNEELLIREQYYIDFLSPQYNICKIANSRLGVKASKETLQKMSIASKGKKQSKETIAKRVEKLKGNKFGCRIISDSEKLTRRKNSKLGKSVTAYKESDPNDVLIFPSIKEAMRHFNLKSTSGIIHVIRGTNKTCKGYKWKYTEF